MMMNITCYEAATGKILCIVSGDEVAIEATKKYGIHPWVDGEWNTNTHYVKDGVAIERPANPATLSGMTFDNVPVPSVLVINGVEYAVTDSVVELELSMPGQYQIAIKVFPYLDGEFVIEN